MSDDLFSISQGLSDEREMISWRRGKGELEMTADKNCSRVAPYSAFYKIQSSARPGVS